MAKERNVELEIRAKNLTKEAFDKVSAALKALEDQSEQTSSKGTVSWGKWFATISGGVAVGNLVASAFKTVGGLLAEIPGQLLEIAKRGNDVADVRESFESLVGGAGEARDVLGSLRTAFGHTVTDFDLMKSSNELLQKGVRLTASEFANLVQGSRILANQVGGNGKENFDKFLSAIGRGNEKELRDLGVNMANIERAIDRHASALGKEASALTVAQRQQALKNATLEEANRLLRENGPIQNGFNDNLQAATVFLENWRDRLGEAIATSPQLNVALSRVTEAMYAAFGDDQQTQVRNLAKLIGQLAIAGVTAASYIVGGAATIARAYYGAREAIDSVFKAFTDKEVRETQRTVDMYQRMFDTGTRSVKPRLDELKSKLDYLKGFSQGLADDARESQATSAKLTKLAQDAQQWLGQLAVDMRKAGDATGETSRKVGGLRGNFAGAGDEAGPLAKLTLDVTKRLREMSAAADAASKNGVLEAWARQNSSALQKLAIDAALVKKSIDGNLRDGIILNMKAEGHQFAAKEFDRIIHDLLDSDFQATALMTDRFTDSLDLRAKALREYADLVEKRSLSELNYQLAIIQNEEDTKIAQLQRTRQATTENLDAVRAVTKEKMAAARKAHNDEVEKMKAAADSWGHRFQSLLESIPQLLKASFTGGGGVSGFLKGVSAQIGESLFGKAAQNLLNKGFQGLFNKGFIGADTLGKLADLVPGLSGMLGSLAGAAIGKIGSWFKGLFSKPEWKKIKSEVARDLGEGISDTLAKTIEQLAKTIEGGTKDQRRKLAELLSLSSIIDEQGGVDKASVDRYARQAIQLFDVIARGGKESGKAREELGKVFTQLVTGADATKRVANESLVAIVRQAQQSGQSIKEIDAFVEQMNTKAAGGFNKLAGAFGSLMTKAASDERDARDELLNLLSSGSQATFDRLGRFASLAATNIRAAGGSLFDVFDQIGEGLDALNTAREEGSLASENAALNDLLAVRQALTAHEELGQMVVGLNELLVGTANTGRINQGVFGDLATQALENQRALQAAGLSAEQAYDAQRETLQGLYELQQRYNLTLGEQEQQLLDDAKAAGVVGDAHKSASERMVDGINKVVTRLDALLQGMGIKLPVAMRTGVDGVVDQVGRAQRALGELDRPRRIQIDVDYNDPGFAPAPRDGGSADQEDPFAGSTIDVRGAAGGGLYTKPTFRVIAEQTPELVGSPNVFADAIATALRLTSGGEQKAAPSAAEIADALGGVLERLLVPPVVVVADGARNVDQIMATIKQKVPRAVKFNEDGFRDALRFALGSL